MIVPKKIEPQTVEHFDYNGKSLGFLNEYENTYLRLKIAREKVSGYYLMFNDKKIEIMSNGKINDWEPGLYDTFEILISKIFQEHLKNKK